ncbi:MAG: fumarylacetoacetate hydrolase family protein [Pseudomonadota bacterium]|nr:fumarylacetoacetate hydrolase family protein [Pseudomonadota bacterium]
MKLVTFHSPDHGGAPRLGAVLSSLTEVLDFAATDAAEPAFRSMLDLIQAGPETLNKARESVAKAEAGSFAEAVLPLAGVSLLAPLPRPEQIRDFLCFERHLRQARTQRLKLQAAKTADPEKTLQEMIDAGLATPSEIWYRQPVYYKGNRFAVVGPDADVVWPTYSQFMDYELEFAAVIGTSVKNATAESARSAIFGYMIFNDFSARDTQADEMTGQLGPAKSKDFDTGNAFGPWLVTADEITDPYTLQMEARVNGELWCSENTDTMYHTFEDIIVHVSKSETLYPGEVIGSGTIGNGSAFETGRRLSDGDVVALSVTGLGELRNRVLAAEKS